MAQAEFLRFLTTVSSSPTMLARYETFSMPALLFHAQNEGFAFIQEDVGSAVGMLEAGIILGKDRDPFDGDSGLWRHMWGQRYLRYLVTAVVSRYTGTELASLLSPAAQPQVTS